MTSPPPTTISSGYEIVTGGLDAHSDLSSLGTTSSSYTTSSAPECNLKENNFSNLELRILGWFLWVAIAIILVGNFACFYAVVRNIKVSKLTMIALYIYLTRPFSGYNGAPLLPI